MLVRNCRNCTLVQKEPPKVEVQKWEEAERVFQRVHIDFAGPFKGHYFFVLVDAFSKWPEVFITKNTTSDTVIQKCRQTFATFGIPEVVVSDNGRHFTSYEFAHFLKTNGIIHKTTAPFHPATSGQAERFIQTLKMALKKRLQENVNKTELTKIVHQFLLHYRTTSHQTTGTSPAEKMLNRRLRTRLDLLLPAHNSKSGNRSTEGRIRSLQVGDRVQCRNYYGRIKWKFGKVEKQIGQLHYIVRLDNGKAWKRHIDQIVTVGDALPKTALTESTEDAEDYAPPEQAAEQEAAANQQPDGIANENRTLTPRRSNRRRAIPERYGDYVVH
ncbi:hypothetical protein KPH14_000859 [Odynerus spinipes]|uniref:Integrase catalytic domain-containing protein n=1 Tax=Odynerus spinipes TaxID=1348599 RepID=A0AAD9VIT5_9HYME|nr:hypothetical protein KPH14_000859 [Odynerus spinipes]